MNAKSGPPQKSALLQTIAYKCGKCKAQFVGKGNLTARYCAHCGSDLEVDSMSKAEVAQASKRILICDDAAVMRSAMGKMLRKMGHEVDEASDGQEALEMAKKNKPDLIISDVMMPNMNGLEFLQRLREDENLQSVEVVMLTGQQDLETIKEAQKYRIKDYILKTNLGLKEMEKRLIECLQ